MLLRCYCGVLLLIFFIVNNAQGIIYEGPSNVTYFPGQTPLPIELICNVTGFATWRVDFNNGTNGEFTSNGLLSGNLDGHSGRGLNILINVPVNNTEYVCVSNDGPNASLSDPAFLYIAAAPDQVPDVAVMQDTITLDGDVVTLTLSWGEPFNNFDPIVNYIVSCSGDVTCPQSFITDSTTRSYTITNLTPMTNYTFSVVATNSIGSGEASVLTITAPSLPDKVTGVILTCEVMDQINQCTVDWDPITVGNGPLEQPLVYEVYYNETRQNVTSSTTTLTFTAPSLPDGVFVDNITVIVTAINRVGRGTPSDPDYFEIMSSSVTDAVTVITPEDATNTTYSITVTCTIDPYSDADMCEVRATGNGQTLTGIAPITNGITINGLACGVTYTITAGGTLNGELVGPRSFHGTTMGPCPPGVTSTIVPTTSMTATPTITPTITPTVSLGAAAIGTACSIILIALTSMITMVIQC